MHWANSQYLYFFSLVPAAMVFFFWAYRQKKKSLLQFAEAHLARQLVKGVSPVKPIVRFVLLLLFVTFALVALMRPQWGTRLETVKRKGVDLMIALDTSLSMDTQDIAPSRLERAKHDIRLLIDRLQGDRVGLVVFAGMSMVNCPLTIDQNAVKLFLEIIDTQIIPRPGTNLSEAIQVAGEAFDDTDRRYKVLVLVTDGENLEGNPVKAAEELAQSGVVIYTLGVGTVAGQPIPVYDEKGGIKTYKKSEAGTVIVSRLDEATLAQIAEVSGGKFFRAMMDEPVIGIYELVSQMDKKNFESKLFQTYVDRFQIPLAIALFFLMLESLVSDRRQLRPLQELQVTWRWRKEPESGTA